MCSPNLSLPPQYRVKFDHQLALCDYHLRLAAELDRPVSMHCVRAYGPLLDLLKSLTTAGAHDQGGRHGKGPTADASSSPQQPPLRQQQPPGLPKKIMLHSYGGSPESVVQFTNLPQGLGSRIYFSFSHAINASPTSSSSSAPPSRVKLIQRIMSVPDDRLLIESDQISARVIDDSLRAILKVVAEAKGWTLEEAARKTYDNFKEFYGVS